jgi:hypothetical protein
MTDYAWIGDTTEYALIDVMVKVVTKPHFTIQKKW